MAIRFLLGNMFKIGTLQGERIAPRAFPSVTAPVCATSRNDREIGARFLKLMTLPEGEGLAQHSVKFQFIGLLRKPICAFDKKGFYHKCWGQVVSLAPTFVDRTHLS